MQQLDDVVDYAKDNENILHMGANFKLSEGAKISSTIFEEQRTYE